MNEVAESAMLPSNGKEIIFLWIDSSISFLA